MIRHIAGELLRHVTARLVLLAEEIDPQPEPDIAAEFVLFGDTNTSMTGTLGTVTWHKAG